MRTVLLLFSLLLMVNPALAQRPHPVDDAGPLGFPLTSRDLGAVTSALAFDADQNGAARALFDGYRAAFLEATAKTNALREKAREQARHDEKPADWPAEVVRYVEQIRGLEKRLLEDVRSLCTPAQAEKFDSAARALRRRQGFRLALAAGEGVDLVEILREMKVDPGAIAGVPEVLTQWEIDVDRALLEKDAYMRAQFPKMISGDDGEGLNKERQEFVRELMRISGQARDINKRGARELETLLPEGAQAAFRKAVDTRTFPRIFGPSRPERVIDESLRLGDLAPEQKDALDRLRADYAREAGPINRRFADAALEMQQKMAEDIDTLMMGSEDPKVPFWAVQKERHELDDRTVAKARAVLNKEQSERVKDPDHDPLPEFLPDVRAFERQFEDEFGAEEEGKD